MSAPKHFLDKFLEQSNDEISQNEQAVKGLAWAIESSLGEFTLTLAHCNYSRLRSQLIQQIQNLCAVEIRIITLKRSVTTLYTAIQAELAGESPSALMVLGLESVENLQQVLSSANQVREDFKKKFSFPLVLWVNDRVLEQMFQWASDFKSWATQSEFVISKNELLQDLQQRTNDVFSRLLAPDVVECLPSSDVYRWEIHTALQELSNWDCELSPDLQANIDLVLGREADSQAQHAFEANDETEAHRHVELARRYFQSSLEFWQQANNLERQGILLWQLGQSYHRQAEHYESRCGEKESDNQKKLCFCWKEAKDYLQTCLDTFEHAQRSDLVAKFIHQLGEVFQRQDDWSSLQALAEKAVILHQTLQQPKQLAQDYCFLADVALHQSNWQDASQYAQQALDLLHSQDPIDPQQQQMGLLLLARAEHQLGSLPEAIAHLEAARQLGEHNRTRGLDYPRIDLQILDTLHLLYFQNKQYLEAFQIKQEQYSVEQRYGLRAFIGPGRLKSQRQVRSTLTQGETQAMVAQEIIASGRKKNVDELIQRIEEPQYKLTILYGQSGVGKSSVIEAGLIPALRQKPIRGYDLMPVLLRVYTNWVQDLGKVLWIALERNATLEKVNIPIPDLASLNTPDAILNQLRQNEHHHLFTVLIFDQFEEFFFVCQQSDEHKKFAQFICQCLNLDEVKIILSLREDYIHRLLQCSRDARKLGINNVILDNILDKKNLYYIGNLSIDDAKCVVQTLTKRSHVYEPGLVDALVRDLAEASGEVRPIELQVVGTQLEAEKITTLAQYQENGPKGRFVQRYLNSVVADCGEENQRAAELALYLLTDENNTRPIKTLAELETDLKAIAQDLVIEAHKLDAVLPLFVEAGLVVLLHESPADRYQLVHDYLVTIIRHQQEPKLTALTEELAQEKIHRQQAEHNLEERNRDLEKSNHDLARSNRDLKKLNFVLERQQTCLQKQKRTLVGTGIGLFVFAIIAAYTALQAQRSEVTAILSDTEARLASGNHLDALVAGLSASRRNQKTQWFETTLAALGWQDNRNTDAHINQTLQAALYGATEFDRLQTHQGSVRSVSFGADGKTIASAGEDGTIKLWNPNKQDPILLEGHQQRVNSVSFSPDGQTIASASADNTIKLWTLDGTPLRTFRHVSTYREELLQASVTSVSFSPDGETIASASANTVLLWTVDGAYIRTLKGHEKAINNVTFSPDGQTIASASADNTVKLWNINGTLLRTLEGHEKAVNSVTFSPDGQTIASASADNTVKLWNINGTLINTLEGHKKQVLSVSFRHDNEIIASASADNTIKLWTLDGQSVRTLTGHEEPVYSVSFSSNGTLVSGSADGTMRLWQPNSRRLLGHTDRITAVSFNTNDQLIATASDDGTVKLWNQEGQYIRSLYGLQQVVNDVSFSPTTTLSPDGQLIATAGGNTVSLWALDGTLLKTLNEHQNIVYSVSFSPNGETIATASFDQTVKLWNRDGTLLHTLEGYDGPVWSVDFTSNGQTLTTINRDVGLTTWTVTLWQLDELQRNPVSKQTLAIQDLVGNGQDINLVKVSPDGQTIAFSNRQDNTVTLWDIANSRKRFQLSSPQSQDGESKTFTHLGFSPDGRFLAAANKDKTISVWDLQTPENQSMEPVKTFTWHEGGFVEKLWFSATGNVIALSDSSGRIILWRWQERSDELKQERCEWVKYYLLHASDLEEDDRRVCDDILSPR